MAELMTMKELQEYMKISRSKAYELAREKGFPTLRVGRTIRIPKDELQKWISQRI